LYLNLILIKPFGNCASPMTTDRLIGLHFTIQQRRGK